MGQLGGGVDHVDAAHALRAGAAVELLDGLQRVQQSLQCAANRGQLPRNLDAHKSAVAFQALFIGLMSNWLFMPRSFDLEGSAVAMVDSFFVMLQHSESMRLIQP